MKLTPKQRQALEWLQREGGWNAPWWGGRPYCGWPKELPGRTFDALHIAKLVRVKSGKWADRTIEITEAGNAALAA